MLYAQLQSRMASKEMLGDQATSVGSLLSPTTDFGAFDLPTHLMTTENELAEDSMRVTYEDPGERDEKKRLMSLLESQSETDSTARSGGRKKGKGLVRRSLRVAGF